MRAIFYVLLGLALGAIAAALAAPTHIVYPTSGKIMPLTQLPVALTWTPGIDPNKIPSFTVPAAQTFIVQGIVCRAESPVGAAATVTVVKAGSGTALQSGISLLQAGQSCNGNPVTAGSNQILPLASQATLTLAAGDTIGLTTTGGTAWTNGTGAGVVTVVLQPPQ